MKNSTTRRIRSKLKAMAFAHGPKMITCTEFEEFVLDYLDGDLPQGKRTIFELHIKFCRECREYLAAYKVSMELGTRLFETVDETLPTDIPEDLVQAIMAARENGTG